MLGYERLKDFMKDPLLQTSIKLENYLLVRLGLRPCSQATLPAELQGFKEMGSAIDQIVYPLMSGLKEESNPRRRLDMINYLKKEMRKSFKKIVEGSEQFQAHLRWADAFRLRAKLVEVRPTVSELYLFTERNVGRTLGKLMKERGKLRVLAYKNATPGLDRARLAYPEEFNGPWLKEMGAVLGYPNCCVEAYANDRISDINVEMRAAKQLEAKRNGSVDPFAYFIGYFFPCKPDCNDASAIGRTFHKKLNDIDRSIGMLYVSSLTENMEKVRSQPKLISEYKNRAEESWRDLP